MAVTVTDKPGTVTNKPCLFSNSVAVKGQVGMHTSFIWAFTREERERFEMLQIERTVEMEQEETEQGSTEQRHHCWSLQNAELYDKTQVKFKDKQRKEGL